MKKDIILTFIFSLIQIILIVAIKGFSYPLLLLFFMLFIFSYISIEDFKTGFISITLNIVTFLAAGVFTFFNSPDLKTIGINLLCFVLPFIIIELIFQLFINRERDEDRFWLVAEI